MSVDILQEKIRKLKNPSIVDFTAVQIPQHITDAEGSGAGAYSRFCKELLQGLKGTVPAVRFHWNVFSLYGAEGMGRMHEILSFAKEQDYYVLLDLPGFSSPAEAELASRILFDDGALEFDGLILQPYLGTDCLKPFVQPALDGKKMLFFLARSANKSASELQDLLTGSRVVHQTVAETAKRLGNHAFGRCHYNEIGAVISATAPSGIKTLRGAFPELFFLMDGIDYVGGNASNCKNGFDRVGHGAAAIAGNSVVCAWMDSEDDGTHYVELAVQAAERMKKNLNRYIVLL